MRFVLDGYNVILSGRRPSRPIRTLNIQAAREALIKLLSRYKAATGHSLVVFFDGSSDAGHSARRRREGGIDIVFSYPDTSADEEIKTYLETAKGRTGLHLVSSDNSIKSFARRLGVRVIDCQPFLAGVRKSLGQKIKDAQDEEPKEKFDGPAPADVEYWLKVFRSARMRRS